MGRSKLDKFKDNDQRINVIQPGKPIFEHIKGNWHKDYFKNENPITVEIGCGRGEYTIGLARKFPNMNFIGADIKGSRIWTGSGIAIEEQIKNVAFLRTPILNLDHHFEKNEIIEIWITFPDPRPRKRDIKRRLTHSRYLEIYKSVIKEKGFIHLKTDNSLLFEYTLEVLQDRQDIDGLVWTKDLYHSELNEDHHGIKTRYEDQFTKEGEIIKYLKFSFNK